MSSLCTYMYARFQSFSPLADRRVNDVLLQTFPSISKALLQLIDIVQTTFVHSLLHESPYLIVDRVKVWAVGRSGLMKSGVSNYVAAYSEICEFSCSVFSKVR